MAKRITARGGQDSLIVLIKTLHQALRGALDESLRGTSYSLAHQAVLATLARMPSASSADLARSAFVSAQSMGEIMQSLETKGWVTRSPRPNNARVLEAKVTPLGASALADAGAKLAKVEERLTGELSAIEEKELRSLLSRCLQALS